MAVDKKSQHVGNHGGRYTDLDGMSKQFTIIDHDKKTTISTGISDDNINEIRSFLKTHIQEQIERILSLPAVNALRNNQGLYEEFVIRDVKEGIIWNEPVVQSACTINSELGRQLLLQTWRSTVKEQYWFEDLTLEEMLNEKWRDWM